MSDKAYSWSNKRKHIKTTLGWIYRKYKVTLCNCLQLQFVLEINFNILI